MSTTPPEKPAAKPVAKRAPARKPAVSKAAAKSPVVADVAVEKPAAKSPAAKVAPKPVAKRATVQPPVVDTAPMITVKSTTKPNAAKPKVPTRRRAKPSSRPPVKPRIAPIAELTAPSKSTVKQAAVVAAGTGGVIAAIGAAFFLWRASKADQPDYRLVERDGDFEIREYPAQVTAATEAQGPRDAALERGFKVLADYIFAKSRDGEKIAMSAPVLSDGSSKSGWRTRFIMPAGRARADLPAPPSGITLAIEPPRRVAAIRFPGRVGDADLAAKEGALRSWLQLRAFPSEGLAEHAFYNSPVMPGPLRRNEVLITLSTR
ncbi:hypothetical protein BH09PSE3_BH09PSE3_08300 [soil metagenome]